MIIPAIRAGLTTFGPGLAARYAAANAVTTGNIVGGVVQEAAERASGVNVPEVTPMGIGTASIYNYVADIVDQFRQIDPEYGAKLEKERLAKSEAMWKKGNKNEKGLK